MKYVGVFVLSLLGVVALIQGAPDCIDTFTAAQCAEYMKIGGAQIVLPLTEIPQLDADKQAMLKCVLANVSDEYVLVNVEPEHVLITNIHLSPDNGNKVAVDFFIANPTGAIVMPTSFRTNELYLVLKLNKEKINNMLEYEVIAIEQDSSTNLPIPTWALAIIVYATIVIIIGLIYYGTKDVRRQWSEAQDKKLQFIVFGDNDMELEAGKRGAGQGDSSKPNGPAKMYRDTQISLGVQVTKEDIAATMSITYATVESDKAAKMKEKCRDSPPPEKSHAPPAYHEATAPSAGDSEGSTSDTSSKKSESEASSAVEGAVNAAYEYGEDEQEGDQITSL